MIQKREQELANVMSRSGIQTSEPAEVLDHIWEYCEDFVNGLENYVYALRIV